MSKDREGKPMLLKAVDTILADPKVVRQRAHDTLEKCREELPKNASESTVKSKAAKRIISRYSNYSAIAGGATAMVSVIPGLGTIIAATGGAMSDAALCMKFQLEMTWELATIHGRNIHLEDEKNLCYLLAGFGALTEIAKQGGTKLGVAALAALSRPYLRGAATTAVKLLFRKLGLLFARKAFEKAIPFGIGLGISMVANKALTRFVGQEVQKFFVNNPTQEVIDVDFTEVP